MTEVNIIEYTDAYAEDFKRISYAWISTYFGIEEEDRLLLDNHKEQIIDKGGAILFAKHGDEIVGTCALIKHNTKLYELAKMGVSPAFQGLKIGKTLARAILEKAQRLGAQKLFLESSSKLTAALSLYEKLGFKADLGLEVTPISRCNVLLALDL